MDLFLFIKIKNYKCVMDQTLLNWLLLQQWMIIYLQKFPVFDKTAHPIDSYIHSGNYYQRSRMFLRFHTWQYGKVAHLQRWHQWILWPSHEFCFCMTVLLNLHWIKSYLDICHLQAQICVAYSNKFTIRRMRAIQITIFLCLLCVSACSKGLKLNVLHLWYWSLI